jgi:hypothetical protein
MKSSSSKVKTVSSLSANQQKVDPILSSTISDRLQGNYSSWFGGDAEAQAAIKSALSGQPVINLDRNQVTKDYMTEVAAPMKNEFQNYVMPRIRETFRKGALFSSQYSGAVSQALQNMQTQLSSGLAGRQWQATTLDAGLRGQAQQLAVETALKGMGTPPGVQEALAYIGTPTTSTYVEPGKASPWADIVKMGLTAGAMYVGGGALKGLFAGGASGQGTSMAADYAGEINP